MTFIYLVYDADTYYIIICRIAINFFKNKILKQLKDSLNYVLWELSSLKTILKLWIILRWFYTIFCTAIVNSCDNVYESRIVINSTKKSEVNYSKEASLQDIFSVANIVPNKVDDEMGLLPWKSPKLSVPELCVCQVL